MPKEKNEKSSPLVDGKEGRATQHSNKTTKVKEKLQKEIAEHRKDGKKLVQKNEYIKVAIELIAPLFYLIDTNDYTVKATNSAAHRDTLSKNSKCYKIVHNRNKPCEDLDNPCPLAEVKQSRKAVIVEHLHSYKDGNIRNLEIHAHPVFDDEGNIVQMIESILDVTALKKMEELLRLSEYRFHHLFEDVAIGVCLLTSNGKFLQSNNTMHQLIGYSEAELGQIQARELFRSREEQILLLKWLKNDGSVHNFEVELIRKDGTSIYINLNATRFKLDVRETFLVSFCNITKQKLAEGELKESERILLEQRLALEQKNMALREVIEQIEVKKRMIRDEISANLNELVMPILQKLRLAGAPSEYLDLLQHHLEQISGAFGLALTKKRSILSPREIEICSMIQGALTSKEIAQLLNISYQTVEKHRRNIRKKFGIDTKQINLSSYLQNKM